MKVPAAVVRAKIEDIFTMLLRHNGFGEITVDVRLLKRGQKEVIVSCGKQYRYVVETPPDTPQDARPAPE